MGVGMRGVGWLFRSRHEIAGDIDEEIAFHLEMRASALMREGLSRPEAEAAARREFGDVVGLRRDLRRRDERVQRRLRVAVWWEELRQDVRISARSLLRTPGFTAAAVCTVAVGIGAAVATFTVVNAVVLRPLPYGEPEQLVRLSPGQNFNIMMAERLEAGAPTLAAVTGIGQWGLVLTGAGDAVQLGAQVVEPEFFDVFAVRPALGRAFREDEREAATSDVVLLSDALWRTRFGGDPSVIGRRIDLDGYRHRSREVIGVMPPDFTPPLANPAHPVDLWIPLTYTGGRTVATDSSWYVNNIVARMRERVQISDVARDVRATMERIRAEASQISEDAVRQSGAAGLLDSVVGDTRRTLWTLLGAVGLVLLLASANLANLLLARGERRREELAARAALGGTRTRIVRELVTESALLAGTGAALGVLLARAVLQLLRVAETSGLPRTADLSPDVRVLLFAIGVTCGSLLLFGLLPALRATAGDLRPALGPAGRVRGQSRAGRRFGSLLIGAEVALAMVLVTGAGLLIASFRSLRSVDPGMDTSDVLAVTIAPSPTEYSEARAVQFHDELIERLSQLPDVSTVGAIHLLPFSGGNWSFPYLADGHEPPANAPLPSASFRVVTPSWFDALDIRLVAGRFFDTRDVGDGAPVGIINRSLAEELWPDQEAVGRQILLFGSEPFMVVGVVDDIRQQGLDAAPRPEIYRPLTQFRLATMTLMLETERDPGALAALVRSVVRSIDEDVPVVEARPLEEVLNQSLAQRRFFLGVLTVFGCVALLLGAIGIYGVMTYTASSRVQEFGVRMALGATDGDVLRSAVVAGLVPVIAGLGAGTLAAVATSRLLEGLLFAIEPHDPAILGGAALVLGTVAVVASWMPARRFSRVEPMTALRAK
ncbi:MAG TPA: ABC transporter permease [Longimicrobiales bacterium]